MSPQWLCKRLTVVLFSRSVRYNQFSCSIVSSFKSVFWICEWKSKRKTFFFIVTGYFPNWNRNKLSYVFFTKQILSNTKIFLVINVWLKKNVNVLKKMSRKRMATVGAFIRFFSAIPFENSKINKRHETILLSFLESFFLEFHKDVKLNLFQNQWCGKLFYYLIIAVKTVCTVLRALIFFVDIIIYYSAISFLIFYIVFKKKIYEKTYHKFNFF